MIPKIIHYCWFGRNPLPDSAQKCIESWRKFFPDYEIKEWNEDNFDVTTIPYTAEAYSVGKYAFVSDYARFWILYKYGGLYFDTDVEVINHFDDIIERGPFMGIEVEANENENTKPEVAPGLGLGAPSGLKIYKTVLDYYAQLHFADQPNNENLITVVKHVTKILEEHGLKATNSLQEVAGIWIYPKDYFNPLNDNTGKLTITSNTRSIHWYSKSWLPTEHALRRQVIRLLHRYLGESSLSWIKRFF